MSIRKLMIKDVRNLASVSLQPSPSINILYGLNGSGKTSVLEAIHLLSVARSFRSARIKPIIRNGHHSCTAFAQVETGEGRVVPVGVSRELSHAYFNIRVAGEEVKSVSDLAHILPLQIINADTFQLLEGAPKQRKQFLDWGVFHVKHNNFFASWKRAEKVLKQRNRLLRRCTVFDPSFESQLASWDLELSKSAEIMDELRLDYFELFRPVFFNMMEQLLSLSGVAIHYYRGWEKNRSLVDILRSAVSRDVQSGYTHSGPHRADIRVRIDGSNVVDVLSRGQLKLVVCALKLAQGCLFTSLTGQDCVFLIDDLPSELDVPHRKALCRILQEIKSQVFITCVDWNALTDCWLSEADLKVFHVKQGTVNLETGRKIRQTESLEKSI